MCILSKTKEENVWLRNKDCNGNIVFARREISQGVSESLDLVFFLHYEASCFMVVWDSLNMELELTYKHYVSQGSYL